jgi:hypothetical protein
VEATGEVAVPRSVRTFVRVFLVAFVVAGLLGIEAWPLTGFRLFANVRTDRQEAMQAVVVGRDGSESALPFWRLPPAYRGSVQVLKGLDGLPAAGRARVCSAWTDALGEVGVEAASIRVYRLSWLLSERDGDRAADARDREVLFDCGGGSA